MDLFDCLPYPFIGIRNVCDPADNGSGLWFDDLPGMNLTNAARTAPFEDVTGRQFLQRIEREAIRLTADDFIDKLSDEFMFSKTLWTDRVGSYVEPYTYETTGTGKHVGLEIERLTDDEYQTFVIDSIEVLSDTSGSFTVYVDDGCSTKSIAAEISANCVARIQVDFETASEFTRIYFDDDGLSLANTSPGSNVVGDGCGCACANGRFSITGVEKGLQATTWTQTSGFNGIRIFGRTICNSANLICRLRDVLAIPIRLRMGILFLEEILASERANRFIRGSSDSAERLLVQWYGGIDPATGFTKSGEYWKKLESAVMRSRRMLNRETSDCLTCGGVRHATNIP